MAKVKSAHSTPVKAEASATGKSNLTELLQSRPQVFGPVCAILALPTTLTSPNDFETIGTVLFTCLLLMLIGIMFEYLGICAHPAHIILDRVTRMQYNWVNNALRSFVELSSFIYVSVKLHSVYNSFCLTYIGGASSGIALLVTGDILTSICTSAQKFLCSSSLVQKWRFQGLFAPEQWCLVGVLFFAMTNRIGINPVIQAFLAAVCLVTLSQLCLLSTPTSVIGSIVHNRLVHCADNWQLFTIRSAVETVSWLLLISSSHSFCTAARLPMLTATLVGGCGGLIVCVIGEICLTQLDLKRTTQRTATVSARLAKSHDKNSGSVFSTVEEQKRQEIRLNKIQNEKNHKNNRNGISKVDGGINPNPKMVWREEEGKAVLAPSVFYRKAKVEAAKAFIASRNGKGITMAEVAKHNSRESLCKAYDITKYIDNHPGGWLPLVNLGGKDVTDAFANYHVSRVYEKLLPSYYIGEIVDYKESEFAKEHREIRQILLRRGLFETNAIIYFTLFCDGFHTSLVGAFFLACFWQQIAFVGHDCGHSSISHERERDQWAGLCLLNTSGGIGLNWWKRSHNVHHVVCNSVENDPDIQHLPVFAVDEKIFDDTKGFWSTYHQKHMIMDSIARFLVSYQHYLFYPIMGVARFNLYIQSFILLCDTKEKVAWRFWSFLSLLFFHGWMLPLVYSSGDTWLQRVAFLLISHGLAGILHVQICISHFTMKTYHGQAYNDDSDEWFKMQVATTMNVSCSPAMDWFHGGLQFQIEHHLWPRLPRHNLREARKLTRALCAKHKIHYHEPSFLQANVELVQSLKRTAMIARKTTKGNGGFFHSQLWEGINAEG
eukprot:GSMAST32.ASY1.ANO1.504.1 assembled CDS